MIPLDELQSVQYYHSDYQHLHIDKYVTGDGKNIFEVCRFGNPYDYINPQYKVTWEVYMEDYPEGELPSLPENAIGLNQEGEPVKNDLYPVWAIFDTIENAYAYAIGH